MQEDLNGSTRRRVGKRGLLAWTGALSAASLMAISVVASASSVAPRSIVAGSDQSVTFAGVTGEGSPNGPGTILVQSWSWGESNHGTLGTGAGQGAGKVTMNSFSITKQVDKASAVLFLACAKGTHFTTVTLNVNPSASAGVPGDAMVITMSDVFISGYSLSSGGDRPTESLSLNFSKIEVKYLQASGLTTRGGWDLKQNKSF